MSGRILSKDFDAIWSQQPISRAIGWKEFISWDAPTRTLRALYEVRPEFCHTRGTIAQGGFVTSWLDSSMAHAVMRDSSFEHNIATLELKVSFMKAVSPGMVMTEARVVRRGQRVAFLEARLLTADQSTLLATASSTGLIIPLVAEELGS
jgi:acyl-CoA thioesterase